MQPSSCAIALYRVGKIDILARIVTSKLDMIREPAVENDNALRLVQALSVTPAKPGGYRLGQVVTASVIAQASPRKRPGNPTLP